MSTHHWSFAVSKRIGSSVLHHPAYATTLARLISASQTCMHSQNITLVGPPQAGKSTALGALVKFFNQNVSETNALGPLPAVRITLKNKGHNGSLDSKSVWTESLHAVQHPFFDTSELTMGVEDFRRLVDIHNATNGSMGGVLERAIHCRQIRLVIFDKAHNLRHAGGGSSKGMSQMLAMLENLGTSTGATILFSGGYPLLDTMAHSPDLLGRQRLIEIRRYQGHIRKDIAAFNSILAVYFRDSSGEPSIFDCRRKISTRGWHRRVYEISRKKVQNTVT